MGVLLTDDNAKQVVGASGLLFAHMASSPPIHRVDNANAPSPNVHPIHGQPTTGEGLLERRGVGVDSNGPAGLFS